MPQLALQMQFLTNAFLLPYLVVRPTGPDEPAFIEDVGQAAATVGEAKPLGPLLAVVGTGAIGWGGLARPEFGDLATRYQSLCELLSDDRRVTPVAAVAAVTAVTAAAEVAVPRQSQSPQQPRAPAPLPARSKRLGTSFVVDLTLFAVFQGWLVDDDLRRWGLPNLMHPPPAHLQLTRTGAASISSGRPPLHRPASSLSITLPCCGQAGRGSG